MRHERLAIVLTDVAVWYEAGFAAQIARELAAIVVLDDDGAAGARELLENRVAVQRDHPTDLQVVGDDALFGEQLNRLLDDAFGGSPADQGDFCIAWADHCRRRYRRLDACDLTLAFVHHSAALDGVGEL